jgi:hypothetical protein
MRLTNRIWRSCAWRQRQDVNVSNNHSNIDLQEINWSNAAMRVAEMGMNVADACANRWLLGH